MLSQQFVLTVHLVTRETLVEKESHLEFLGFSNSYLSDHKVKKSEKKTIK